LVDRALLGVVGRVIVDLRGERRLAGESPFTPRARRSSARAFPSAGAKILMQFFENVIRQETREHSTKNAQNVPTTVAKARFQSFMTL